MMGVKIHDMFARKPGTSLAQFSTYWTSTHAPIAQRFTQIQHYTQCHRVEQQPRFDGFATTWPDGCAETWYASVDSLAEMVASARFPELMHDETNFMNLERARPLIASEERLVDDNGFDVNARGVKLLVFAARRSGLTEDAFMPAWARADDATLGRTLGVTRHIVCTPVAAGILIQADKAADGTSADARPYDAVRELWWPSAEALHKSRQMHATEWEALLRLDTIDRAHSMALLAQERVIIA